MATADHPLLLFIAAFLNLFTQEKPWKLFAGLRKLLVRLGHQVVVVSGNASGQNDTLAVIPLALPSGVGAGTIRREVS